tara:strand:- start:206 stop:424 length:219 start_codon:yes stop_codon:yes gene_type:complete
MSDSIKKWHEMQESKILSDQGGKYTVLKRGGPIVSIEKKKVYDAFIYNLNCYDAKIIDREDFINAMEDYIYE